MMEPKFGQQLEIFRNYLEDVPDYQKKLKTWEFLNLSDEQQRNIKSGLIPFGPKYPSPVGAAKALNNKAGFPLFQGNPKAGVVTFIENEALMEYCKDLFDKNGELLPSKEQKKAA